MSSANPPYLPSTSSSLENVSQDSTSTSIKSVVFLSVTQLLKDLNEALLEKLPLAYFTGELGPVTRATSGHLYFSVKDSDSKTAQTLQAVMWRGNAQKLTFLPKEGVSVKCRGVPTIYPAGGRLQIVVDRMEEGGEGALKRRFELLKQQLAAEGLFAVERKRKLPFFPKNVGIVTSETGAVIHDMMVKIRERMPSTKVTLVNVKVQGTGAAKEIAAGIVALNQLPEIEVIIVARGGGSLEDLWSFNEEEVVRAIFASRLPVISGVGHEVDVTLADLVADLRAPTPTAAAEAVVPHREALLNLIKDFQRRLLNYNRWFALREQNLDEISLRFFRLAQNYLLLKKNSVSYISLRLESLKPTERLGFYRSRISDYELRLKSINRQISQKKELLSERSARLNLGVTRAVPRASREVLSLERRLEGINPLNVLARGYALIKVDNQIIDSITSIESNTFTVQMHDGEVNAKVHSLKSHK
jgi:exodeoxyribonuclease VII large subunit